MMNYILQVLATVLNTENLTLNNVGFVAGLTVVAGLIVFGLLKFFVGAFLSILVIAIATAYFGYRTALSEEDVPTKTRMPV